MSWNNVLRSAPDRLVNLPRECFSYLDLALEMDSLQEISSHIIWEAEWSREGLARLLKGLDSGYSIVVKRKVSADVVIQGFESGWIFLESSGSEGPSRYLMHETSSLNRFIPLYQNSSCAACLEPGHAAGIEFFLSALKGKNHITLASDANSLRGLLVDNLHGPPQLLGYMLSFPSMFKNFLKNLKTFYNGTDRLHEIWVSSKNKNYNFKILQVYGSTETWSIDTLTHPEKSWLLKIIDSRVTIHSGYLEFKGSNLAKWEIKNNVAHKIETSILSDHFIEVEGEWGYVESKRHWKMKFFGQMINLFDLEEMLLELPYVIDVTVKSGGSLITEALNIELVTEAITSEEQVKKEVISKLGIPAHSFNLRLSNNIQSGKKRRQT